MRPSVRASSPGHGRCPEESPLQLGLRKMKIRIARKASSNCISIPPGEYEVHLVQEVKELEQGAQIVLTSGSDAYCIPAAIREASQSLDVTRVRFIPTLAMPLWLLQAQSPPQREWISFLR